MDDSGRHPRVELQEINFSGYSGDNMWKNLLLTIFAGMLISSCSTAGCKYDTTAVDRIMVNQTTDREVLAMLGKPSSERQLINGIKIYNYAYGKKCFSGFGTSVNSLEVQSYNGVVINKRQCLTGD
jgi:hypothetical protein